MDPITVAAAIQTTRALVKSAKGISDIAHNLDGLFHARDEHKKNESKKKRGPKTRMQQILRMRSGDEGYDDDTSISSVANDVLEQKQIDRNLELLAREIDRKWGDGTWQSILDERKKRLEQKKEIKKKNDAAAKAKAEESKEFWRKIMIESGKGLIVIMIGGGLVWFLWWAATHGPAVR
jgi:tRNA nucleotidyltransferase/poly(A) polymerase